MSKPKQFKVYIENEKGALIKDHVDYGVFFSSSEKDQLNVKVVGESTFEQMNDIIYSGLYHLYEAAVKNYGEKNRTNIYERAVQMFSLIIDKFYPEGKDKRFGVLTDEDIKEAEDSKIERLSKQK